MQDPSGYTNALLTALALSPPTAVTIGPGRGVPDLQPFIATNRELEWISELGFSYDAVDATRVVAILLHLAGYRLWHVSPRNYVFEVSLATGGPEPEPVRFEIMRAWR